MFKLFVPYFSMPRSAALILSAAALALIVAFTMQYSFGVEPCVLCLWQRVPYACVVLLSLVALLWRPHGHHTQIILMMCTAALIVETGLAIFHTGVELHWWLGTTGCAIQPLNGSSVEDLRTQLLHTVVARCDQISWTFLGFSMANWNVPFAAALAVFSGIASIKAKK